MSPVSKKRNGVVGSGSDRFGYRPSQEMRRDALLPQEHGRNARQELLDRIQFDRLEKQWRRERIEKGREGWHGFGNEELPIERYRHDIMRMISGNRISLLAGTTGSGKSTQLAQYALEMGYDHIVYLQPRRVLTDNIADRLELELSAQFTDKGLAMPDHLVGMAHSERSTLRDDSIIQVMTSAVFKKRAPELQEEWRDKRVLIVADEIHEANIETEFAVATAAELMTEQESWNMVLMSATPNIQEVQDAYSSINGRRVPSITVEGRPHAITRNEVPDKNVVEVFFDECLVGGNKTLIFTDGKRSLKAIRDEIERRAPPGKVKVLLLHSKISDEARKEIFYGEDEPGVHTVIISTSAGQSGLTISGVDRVVSDGWTKSPELDAENASGLPRRLCTRAELTQQMGRGGRDVAGGKYFLAANYSRGLNGSSFTGFDDGSRAEHIPADIYHTVITRNVLSAAAMDRDFYNLNEYLIHKVTHGTIREAYVVLMLLGAVNDENQVTDVGREMDRYPLRPELARAIVEVLRTDDHGLWRQVAAIASSIEAGGLTGYEPQSIELRDQRLSTDTKDDFLAQLDLFLGARKFLCADDPDDTGLASSGIDVHNAARAYKQYAKICKLMGLPIDVDQYELSNTFTARQREIVKQMFLSGMPHLIYDEVRRAPHRGRRKKNPDGSKQPQKWHVWYRNILGPPKGTSYKYDRQMGKRSVMAHLILPQGTIIAGYPRWYVHEEEGDVENVIELGFPTNRPAIRRAMGRTALSLGERTEIGSDGRLRIVHSGHIGRLRTREDRALGKADTPSRVDILSEVALEKPGASQRELRKLKKFLERLAQRVPEPHRSHYFDRLPLSQEELVQIVRTAAVGAGSLGELDSNIRQLNLSWRDFISQEKLDAIVENMPDELEIGGTIFPLNYEGDSAIPVIRDFPLSLAGRLPDQLRIRDGRKVRFRYNYDEGDVRYLFADEVKVMSGV